MMFIENDETEEEEEVEYEYESDDGVDSVVDAVIDVKPTVRKADVGIKTNEVIDLTGGEFISLTEMVHYTQILIFFILRIFG